MLSLITFFVALSGALANPTVLGHHANYGHLHQPTANFAPQPMQPFTNQVHQPFNSPVQPISAPVHQPLNTPVQPLANPAATPFTTTNTNRRGRWLADPIAVEPAFKQVWSPSYSPAWSSWAPGSAWGTSGLYYSAPVAHKAVAWQEPTMKVDPTWKYDTVGWVKPAHYAGWAHEPVSAKWISGDKWVTDKWSTGWESPAYGPHVTGAWASPMVKRSWAEVKPSPVGYYSAGFDSKPWDVKPIIEKGLEDPSKPFSYSSHVVHA